MIGRPGETFNAKQWCDRYDKKDRPRRRSQGETRMETLTIQLTKAQKAFAEAQAAEGGFRTVSKYLEDLLRAERRRKAEEELLKLVQEAEASGPPTPMTRDDWERIREKAMSQLAREKEDRAKNRKNARSRK